MVRFEGIRSLGGSQGSESPPRPKAPAHPPEGGPFEAALRAEQERLERAGAPGGPSAEAGRRAVAGGERLLDAAEAYRVRLSDPQVTLRELEPWVRTLERERDRTVEEARSLPEGDRGRELLLEAAALATAESAKFRRGDYV